MSGRFREVSHRHTQRLYPLGVAPCRSVFPLRSFFACLVITLFASMLLPTPGVEGALGAPAAADLVIDDPVGDNVLFGLDEGTPVAGLYGHADVERFIVGRETTDSFAFVFDFVGRTEPGVTVAEALAVEDVSCTARFGYDDMEQHRFYLDVWMDDELGPGGAPPQPRAYYYRDVWSEEEYAFDWYDSDRGDLEVAWDADDQAIVVTFDKAKAALPGGEPPAKGHSLRFRDLRCDTDVGFLMRLDDRIEFDGESYAFVEPGAGEMVSVRFGESVPEDVEDDDGETDTRVVTHSSMSRTGPASLAPGETAVLPLTLHNKVDTKRIVTLTAKATDLDGGVLPWNVTLAPQVALNAKEARIVKLLVTPTAGAEAEGDVRLQVDLAVLGMDAPGRAVRTARVVPVLEPGSDTYGFFTRDTRRSQPPEIDPVVGTPHALTLSLRPAIEGWGNEPVRPAGLAFSGWRCGALDPLGKSVRLDPEGEFALTLDLGAEQEGRLEVGFWFYIDGEAVFRVEEEVRTGQVVEIRRPVVTEDVVFPAGADVSFEMHWDVPLREGALSPILKPAGSSFHVPVLTALQQELNVTDGRFLPTLALAGGEDKDAYVNPGKVYTFFLVLANEGVETDDLSVAVTAEGSEGWKSRLVPGKSFRVPAGNATRFGVEMTAPAGAIEGERVEIVVEAASKHDPAASARIRLGLTTTELPFPDRYYEADEDQIPALPDERKESPGPSLFVPLSLLGLVVLVVRRRSKAF